jgi:hypothetical protein
VLHFTPWKAEELLPPRGIEQLQVKGSGEAHGALKRAECESEFARFRLLALVPIMHMQERA